MIELVGIYEIAQLAGVSKQCVVNWINRYKDFPEPIAILKSARIYDKQDVITWLKNSEKV